MKAVGAGYEYILILASTSYPVLDIPVFSWRSTPHVKFIRGHPTVSKLIAPNP